MQSDILFRHADSSLVPAIGARQPIVKDRCFEASVAPSRCLPVHSRISCTHRLARLTDSNTDSTHRLGSAHLPNLQKAKKRRWPVSCHVSASLMQAEFPTETRHRHSHRKREAMGSASILRITQHMPIAINLNY